MERPHRLAAKSAAPRSPTTLLATLGLVAAGIATACGSAPGQPPADAAVADAGPDASAPDADPGPDVRRVRGIAVGVAGPLTLALTYPGGTEQRTITANGPFAFDAAFQDGDDYFVQIAGLAPCDLADEAGTIDGADAAISVGCALLTTIDLSGPTGPTLAVTPGVLDYDADVSLLHNAVSITAAARLPDTSITIAGATVPAGQPTPEQALDLGGTTVAVTAARADWTATYRVAVTRGVPIVQAAYAKASNPEALDELGWFVAVSGDLMAVGARYEDSGASGVNGDQTDNSSAKSGAVYVFRRDGDSWVQEAYIKASNPGAGDQFGRLVALSGDTLAVAAHYEDSAAAGVNGDQIDDSAPNTGAVYIFRRTAGQWAQEAYIKASNPDALDYFGESLALSGDTLAVGAYFEDSGASGIDGDQTDNSVGHAGAVYVFRRTGTEWAQEAYVKASNPDVNDEFGASVALSGDTLAVGAVGESSESVGVNRDQDNDLANDSGAVYVFRRTGTEWAQEAYIKASNTDPGDWFGFSVALSGDALAVGALQEDSAAGGVDGSQDSNVAYSSGAAYVFRRVGTVWSQEAYVKASQPDAFDNFGYSVALSGSTLAVGSVEEDSASTGIDGDPVDNGAAGSGAVFVYAEGPQGWAQRAYLKASNTGVGDSFGIGVALSGDTLVVGARDEDSAAPGIDGDQADDNGGNSGAVYIFH